MTDLELERVRELAKDPTYPAGRDAYRPLEKADRLTFEGGKRVTTEQVVSFLRWRALGPDGTWDEEELESDLALLQVKRVVVSDHPAVPRV